MHHPLRSVPFMLLAMFVAVGCGASPAPTAVPASSPVASGPRASANTSAAPTEGPASPARSGTITVDPAVTPIDEPVAIQLSGFAPDTEVTVRATTVGTAYPNLEPGGSTRTSSATFRTNAQGAVDLATQAPLSGSYTMANAMGLFWSMKDAEAGTSTVASPRPDSANPGAFVPYRYEITAEVDGAVVARATLDQNLGSPDVTEREISEDGVLGQYYVPPGPGPFPAVIVLSGSDGGLTQRRPKVLAAHGYAVLSLPYFNYTSPLDGTALPTDTVDLPLEYFGKAIDWLQAQPAVDPDRIGMYGTSLGGEVSLLVAARYPQIKAVIAIAPPSITWDAGPGHSSFSYRGKPVPNVVPFGADGMAQPFRDAVAAGNDPMAKVPDILSRLNGDPAIEAAIPRVEDIHGSILVVSGTEDTQLPSTVAGELFMDRLAKHEFAFPYRHIVGQGAGHLIDHPFVDRSSEIANGGGTPEANEMAAETMWPVVLEYLAAMR